MTSWDDVMVARDSLGASIVAMLAIGKIRQLISLFWREALYNGILPCGRATAITPE